jgi:hypothetical protein
VYQVSINLAGIELALVMALIIYVFIRSKDAR